jgi:putative thiamine transport system ATP-binding protein
MGVTAARSPPLPLRLAGVRIELAGRELVPPLDLAIAPGECVTVMGPSGCGKSTLLAMVSGTLDAVFRGAGRVYIGDADLTGLPPERRRIGIQFQDDLLFPHLSVAENLAFALPRAVTGRAERRCRARWPRRSCRASRIAIRRRCPAASAPASR